MSSTPPAQAGRKTVMSKFKRPKKYKPVPGQPSDTDLIAAFLANGGQVKVYQPGVADGAIRSHDQGLVSSAY